MWTITEIANKIMKYSSPISKNQDCTFEEVGLPEKYYEVQSSNFTNDKIYLPNEFLENNFHSNFLFNVRLMNNFLLSMNLTRIIFCRYQEKEAQMRNVYRMEMEAKNKSSLLCS